MHNASESVGARGSSSHIQSEYFVPETTEAEVESTATENNEKVPLPK